MNTRKCLVVLSGGQDSITCLGIALGNFAQVEAISFAYNQRHAVELTAAAMVCKRHNVPHKVVQLGQTFADLVNSALLSHSTDDTATAQPHPDKPGLPASFVPGRNALFLTLAHAYAQTIGAGFLMTGVCETDYSGYPDCRAEFIEALQSTLNLGYQTNIVILTPLMNVNKAETFALAADYNFLQEVLELSQTCYNGDTTVNEWGKGCGHCPACILRERGYREFMSPAFADRRDLSAERAVNPHR